MSWKNVVSAQYTKKTKTRKSFEKSEKLLIVRIQKDFKRRTHLLQIQQREILNIYSCKLDQIAIEIFQWTKIIEVFCIIIKLCFQKTYKILILKDSYGKWQCDWFFWGAFNYCHGRCVVSTSGIFKQSCMRKAYLVPFLIKKRLKFEKISKHFNLKTWIKPFFKPLLTLKV